MNIPTSHWWNFSWHGLGVGKSSITLTLSFYIDSALGVESSLHKTGFFHVLPPAPDPLTRECLEARAPMLSPHGRSIQLIKIEVLKRGRLHPHLQAEFVLSTGGL